MMDAIFCWSGGKDSSYALYKVLQEGIYQVKYLLSTFNGQYHRLSMHGVRESLIEAQAAAIGIPLLKVYVYGTTNEEYERQMAIAFTQAKNDGAKVMIYGDIFLEDLRKYREAAMQPIGLQCVFPIWKTNTGQLVQSFIELGFKTITCCVDNTCLDESWVGRIIDKNFVALLPSNVDACGENGEFHSFCFEGPIFKQPVTFTLGEKTFRPLQLHTTNENNTTTAATKGFWYIELIPM